MSPRRSRDRGQTVSVGFHEAIRVLRSNLLVALSDLEQPRVLVTSAQAGEGKTSTCAHLAVALARAGRRVVALDLDLRQPELHRWLGAHNEHGFADILLDRRTLDDCLQYLELDVGTGHYGMYFLAAGAPVSNATELLGTARTQRLLQSLADQADIVLIDTPPVLPVADTLVIGRTATGALLVVEARRTAIGPVVRAKDALTRNQTRLLGVIVNKLQPQDALYSYGYGYGSEEEVTLTSGAVAGATAADLSSGGNGSHRPSGSESHPTA